MQQQSTGSAYKPSSTQPNFTLGALPSAPAVGSCSSCQEGKLYAVGDSRQIMVFKNGRFEYVNNPANNKPTFDNANYSNVPAEWLTKNANSKASTAPLSRVQGATPNQDAGLMRHFQEQLDAGLRDLEARQAVRRKSFEETGRLASDNTKTRVSNTTKPERTLMTPDDHKTNKRHMVEDQLFLKDKLEDRHLVADQAVKDGVWTRKEAQDALKKSIEGDAEKLAHLRKMLAGEEMGPAPDKVRVQELKKRIDSLQYNVGRWNTLGE